MFRRLPQFFCPIFVPCRVPPGLEIFLCSVPPYPAFSITVGRSGTPGMRLLVLTDIHANLSALEASLNAAEGSWQRLICLGDVVGYGPDPNEVTSRIRELGAVKIRGNHYKEVPDLLPTEY